MAMVWVQGADSKQEAYRKLAIEFQAEACAHGYKFWVGIPWFLFETPVPYIIDIELDKTIAALKTAGWKGEDVYMSSHSVGGVMSQNYTVKHPKFAKANIFMGSSLLRDKRENDNSTGHTHFDYPVPSLVLAGSKDGLFRISRNAESYFHQVENIDPAQAGMFPVVLLKGVSHGSFMDETMLPIFVAHSDLKPDVSQEVGYKMIVSNMVSFIAGVEGDHEKAAKALGDFKNEASDFFQPFIDGMVLEGSYNLKIPCYNKNLVNPDSPKECMRGSPWVSQAQVIMGGSTADEDVTIDTFDNFHRVYVTTPHHLPQVNNTCPEGGPRPCKIEGLTVTENYYHRLSGEDTGLWEQAAVEQKAKMLSRQDVQWHAGHVNASFDDLDQNAVRCEEINQKALDWGLAHADKEAIAQYNSVGKKLVIGEDLGPYNEGPLWIWTYISYKDNADKTETVVRSPNMRTTLDYWEIQVGGFHYCKLLSPYRALEWIYIDALYDRAGRRPYSEKYDIPQLQKEAAPQAASEDIQFLLM